MRSVERASFVNTVVMMTSTEGFQVGHGNPIFHNIFYREKFSIKEYFYSVIV